MFRSRDEIAASLLSASVPGAAVEELVRRAKPAVWLKTVQASDENEIALGKTKVGGCPDMSAVSAWPRRAGYAEGSAEEAKASAARLASSEVQAEMIEGMQEDGESDEAIEEAKLLWATTAAALLETVAAAKKPAPLSFVAQIDFAEICRAGPVDDDIPRDGRLLFFYDAAQQPWGFKPGDAAGAAFIFDQSPAQNLSRHAPPAGTLAFPACDCEMHGVMTPPALYSIDWDACVTDKTAQAAAQEWWWDVFNPEPGRGTWHDHRVGGHASQIQNDMQSECADASTEQSKNAADWLLLMQIASDNSAEMGWGDSGYLYVWINRQALRQRNFNATRVILQCL